MSFARAVGSEAAASGKVALLTGVPRTAYVRANTFCITAHLTKEGFEPIVHKWPEEIDVLLSGIEAEADRQKIKEEATKHYRLGGRRRSSLSSFGVPSPPSGAHRGAGRLSVGSGPGRRPRGRRAPWRAGEPAWRPRRRPPLGRRGAAAPLVLVGKPGGAGGEPLSPLSPLAPASPASPPAPAWRDPLPPTTRGGWPAARPPRRPGGRGMSAGCSWWTSCTSRRRRWPRLCRTCRPTCSGTGSSSTRSWRSSAGR
ncbi:unnamed protein product [Prorocentrum cordatum]|uniref:Cyclic nucleotide-binding domain-containing protein n=1 Tax=Prorocentrum cordatum TaxID=2364126 RepID=A0ABN9SSA3_9DINO|nr:unnamed protein product [Polarella glacialis]